MLKSSPNDVLVLDSDSLTLARFARPKRATQLLQLKTTRISGAFAPAPVTPTVQNASILSEAVRKLRVDSGTLDRVALLLPDSWLRMNLIDLADLPERRSEADEVIRWSLKRSLPPEAEQLRMAWQVIGRVEGKKRVFVVSGVEKTLAAIDATLRDAGLTATIIEPIGLNLWNAITAREANTARERLMIHVREGEFTTAVFRGADPVFVRSRNVAGDRNVAQEIRLSASYLRDNLRLDSIEQCYIAGSELDEEITRIVSEEFGAPVQRLVMRDYVEPAPGLETPRLDSEVIACTGVFTA